MSVSVFDHPYLGGLFGDPEIAPLFSAATQLGHMIAFEAVLARAFGATGRVGREPAEQAAAAISAFKPDMELLRRATGRDGLPVPELIRQIKVDAGPEAAEFIHKGSTSQDLLDTALMVSVAAANRIFEARISALNAAFETLAKEHGATPLMGRTRMQAALPITVADRVAAWCAPLSRHLDRLSGIRPRLEVVQFGGPVGNRVAFGDDADAIEHEIAAELGLGVAGKSWHSTRDALAEYAAWLSLVTGGLGKIGQDICLMAQQGIDEIELDAGGRSSAMPHKHNPVKAELLVTLARFNAVQVSGMHHALGHEQERSGTAWPLEWMILPQMVVATGSALRTAADVISGIRRIGSPDA